MCVISNMLEALETPRTYHGIFLPLRKYELIFLDALFEMKMPIKSVNKRYTPIIIKSII